MLLLALATLALGAQDAAPAPAAKPAKEKKVCRAYQTTGSIMPGRSTCHTPAEWAAIDKANSDAVSRSRFGSGLGDGRGIGN